ncbi:hypothetical protein AB5N19_07103 [Seiridium cardinale]
MASARRAFGHDGDIFPRSADVSDGNLHPAEHASWENERFTPSPIGQESRNSTTPYDTSFYNGQDDDFHGSTPTSKEYQPVATSTFKTNEYETPPPGRSHGLVTRVLLGWWKELVWSVISVACIPALIGMLRRFDNQPLPDWPHGITLNTAVAFISTLCRTAFLLPVVEALSQLKWNWYRKPRSLQDFRVFDEASRGPWGSLKLLFTTKGRGMGVLAALILVSSIATSTLTQSVVTYPTHMTAFPGNGTATSVRSTEYFWATANMYAQRDTMLPFTLAIPQAIYTRPENPISYTPPTCRTSECTWDHFTTLAVCMDMKNITDQMDTGGEIVNDVTGSSGGSNITLPNGAMLHPTYGFRNMNISAGTSVSFNNTDMIKAPILDYTIMFWPPSQARAYEVLLHFCVNTYSVAVKGNIPTVDLAASYTNIDEGEVFVKGANQTYNVTYLTTPDDPGEKFVADGMGPGYIGGSLASSITGAYTYLGDYNMSAGVGVFGAAIERAIVGVNSNDSQAIDDAQYAGIYNLSSNIAMALTNALTEWSAEPAVNGTALTQQTFVSIRWEWVTLLVVQVFLSLVVLIVAIFHTEMIGIPIIKGNPLPGLFAISAQEKYTIEQQQMGITTSVPNHVLDGDLKRVGNKWVLGSVSGRRHGNEQEPTIYVGEHGNWAS